MFAVVALRMLQVSGAEALISCTVKIAVKLTVAGLQALAGPVTEKE